MGYRPPQWGYEDQLFSITDKDGNIYFFDAPLRLSHDTTLRITEHPVQSGVAITDHSYVLPARLSVEIGISDAMDSYMSGQWGEAKSVNAYQTLLDLQQTNRMLLTIMTRLNTYDNMVIERIEAPDDFKTKYGLRALVTFREIIVASLSLSASGSSSLPHVTDSTSTGSVQPEAIDNTTVWTGILGLP